MQQRQYVPKPEQMRQQIERWTRVKLPAKVPDALLYRPHFLWKYPAGDRQFNLNSFLGQNDPWQGKYYVSRQNYDTFLREYYQAITKYGLCLYLTESYQKHPYRYFQELDFDWTLPRESIDGWVRSSMSVVQECVREEFRLPADRPCIVSMRTPYKVHLNFPSLITTEQQACRCRERIIQQCRTTHPEVPDLDWEKVIDVPHGSLRLLGSLKPDRLDKDPEWVATKAYGVVELRSGVWKQQPLSLQLIQMCSIQPTEQQLSEFEASPDFLELVFQEHQANVDKRQARIKERQEKRATARQASEAHTLQESSEGQALHIMHEARLPSNESEGQMAHASCTGQALVAAGQHMERDAQLSPYEDGTQVAHAIGAGEALVAVEQASQLPTEDQALKGEIEDSFHN